MMCGDNDHGLNFCRWLVSWYWKSVICLDLYSLVEVWPLVQLRHQIKSEGRLTTHYHTSMVLCTILKSWCETTRVALTEGFGKLIASSESIHKNCFWWTLFPLFSSIVLSCHAVNIVMTVWHHSGTHCLCVFKRWTTLSEKIKTKNLHLFTFLCILTIFIDMLIDWLK